MRLRFIRVASLLFWCVLGFLFNSIGDERDGPFGISGILDDTDRHYTTVGNIGLTVSNFGTVGTRNAYWPQQPSCEYPRGSRIEHIYQGGLWVGVVSRNTGQQLVSTGATDQASASRIGQGYELTSELGGDVTERSSLPESQFFEESAISHQDFLTDYSDKNRRNPATGDTIPEHTPIGISIHQESYAWNFPFADYFVILNYTIYNTSADTLDSVYVGFWNNAVIRNTNRVVPFATPSTSYFGHGANGYLDTTRMMYSFDFDGIPSPPPADSYLGIKLLGSRPFPRGVDSVGNLTTRTYYNAWRFREAGGAEVHYHSPIDDAGFSPTGARSRYDRMASSLAPQHIAQLRTRADNMTTLLSTGPFETLYPGDSLQVVFGVICARKFGTAHASTDTREQRKTLVTNAGFAQQAYDGEDVNGNNVLDPGEDLNGNGKLDHFQLPQPPRPPKVRAEVENQKVTIYWDKANSEFSLDPITREFDFEGYRVFRSNPGSDFTSPEDLLLTLTLVGEFDVPGNSLGYNTGFSAIALPQAREFPADTIKYWYRFPPEGLEVTHLNGWQYLYGVAAFDRGDSVNGITPLQSKMETRRVIPGTSPTSSGDARIGVYPNPYYVNAVWDGAGERNRKVYFYNLPQRCEIRIYTLAGDIVADMMHDAASYDGSNIDWFRRFSGQQTLAQFAGGEHAWDLITKFDQAIATGLYLFSVRDSDSGEIKTGKFLVIK
ncbi:MAG: hypothetical protein HY708_07855 [Ignavibacteriae bacterium]|nr:hypothetical protein [Ignavibacteriota bacterium]